MNRAGFDRHEAGKVGRGSPCGHLTASFVLFADSGELPVDLA